MSAADEFNEAVTSGERRTPSEIESRLPCGLNLMGNEGFVTIQVDQGGLQDGGSFEWVLNHYGLSPEFYEVDEDYPIEVGSYQMGYTTQTLVGYDEAGNPIYEREGKAKDLFRYKVKIRRKRPGNKLNDEAVDEIVKRARKRKKVGPPKHHEGETLIANISDLQVGKGDFGGTQALMDRVEQASDNFLERVKKDKPRSLVIADLGDATEGCHGFYPDQTWTVELNTTQQIRVATEIFHEMLLDRVVNLVPDIHMVFVPSNHGEFRAGKGNTPTDRSRDNADLIIADNIARVARSHTDRYGHVNIWTPPYDGGDAFVVTLEIEEVMLAWTHGHQISGGAGNRIAGIEKWWQNQRWSDRARPGTETEPTAADADILNVGHGHHFLASQRTGRLAMQMPAMENGSESFTASTGIRSSAGWLSYQISKDFPLMANRFHYL